MTTGRTPNLDLALPVEGELDGTWGDEVNNGITDYVDIAVAGTLTLNGDGAVTLAKTQGSAAGDNIGSTTAQYAILKVTGTTTTKTITAPSTSKTYVVINATSFDVVVKASGQTGVTVAAGTRAAIAFNGTDYALVGTNDISKLSGILSLANGGTGAALTDPNADRILFWDDSAGQVTWLTVGTGISISGTTISATGSGGDVVGPASATDSAIVLFDGVTGKLIKSSTSTLPTGAVVGTTDTQTLTNKRVTARVVAIADAATITPTGDTADQYEVTALAQAATIAAPSGTPTDGQKLILRIKDNGTARALTWTTTSGAYRAVGVTLPTTTVLSKVVYIGCIWNAQDNFWDAVAVAQLA